MRDPHSSSNFMDDRMGDMPPMPRNYMAAFNGGMREIERGALGLPPDKLVLVRDKKEDIEKAYRQDCETFAAVTKMLIRYPSHSLLFAVPYFQVF